MSGKRMTNMERYEVGSIYKIETAKSTYYIRLYEGHDYAVYAPITSDPTLETFEHPLYYELLLQ